MPKKLNVFASSSRDGRSTKAKEIILISSLSGSSSYRSSSDEESEYPDEQSLLDSDTMYDPDLEEESEETESYNLSEDNSLDDGIMEEKYLEQEQKGKRCQGKQQVTDLTRRERKPLKLSTFKRRPQTVLVETSDGEFDEKEMELSDAIIIEVESTTEEIEMLTETDSDDVLLDSSNDDINHLDEGEDSNPYGLMSEDDPEEDPEEDLEIHIQSLDETMLSFEDGVILVESSDEDVPNFDEASGYESNDPYGGTTEYPTEDPKCFLQDRTQSPLPTENESLEETNPQGGGEDVHNFYATRGYESVDPYGGPTEEDLLEEPKYLLHKGIRSPLPAEHETLKETNPHGGYVGAQKNGVCGVTVGDLRGENTGLNYIEDEVMEINPHKGKFPAETFQYFEGVGKKRVLLFESLTGGFEEFKLELSSDEVIVIQSTSDDMDGYEHGVSVDMPSKDGDQGKGKGKAKSSHVGRESIADSVGSPRV